MTLTLYPNISSIAPKFDGICLDAYGVFWESNAKGPFEGSAATMEALVSAGKVVGILSNSSQRAAKECEKLSRHGIHQNSHYHFLLTSGEVAASLFKKQTLPFETPRKTYWVFSDGHPRFSSPTQLFGGSPFQKVASPEEADFIYIGIPHLAGEDQSDPECFRPEIESLIASGLWMVCANPDRMAHEGMPPRQVVRQGSIGAIYEALGGKVLYIGKPEAMVYECALDHFRTLKVSDPEKIVMVGDTPETDIRGAKKHKMKTALVTHTGIMAERLLREPRYTPAEEDISDFYLERLS